MAPIRNIAVGLTVRAGHVLMSDGFDRVANETFHRAIGGGIEFGETAEVALRREFLEELNVTLSSLKLLTVLENILVYEGLPGHEIVHVFAVESPEINAFPLYVRRRILDEGSTVRWVSIGCGTHPFYPTGVGEILRNLETDG